jgi:hypothetical protein
MANRDEPAIFQARVAKNSNSDALYLYEYQWIRLDATATEPTPSSDYLSYQPLDSENTSPIKIPNPTLHFIPGDVIRLLTPQNFGLKLYKISNSLVNGVYDFVVDSNAVATESQNKLEYQPQASTLGDDFYGFLCTSETSNFLSDDYYILLDTSGSFTISSDDAKILQTTQDASFFAQPGQIIKIKSSSGSEQILTVASSQYNELSFAEDITIGNVSEIYIQDNKLQIVFILSGGISNGQFDNGDILDNVTEDTTFQEDSFTNPNPLQPSEDIDPLTITPPQDEVDPNLEVSSDSLRAIQKINGKVSFSQIENFIESAKDIDISDNNLSLESLFNQSTGDEIDLTAGDRIRPHKMSEFLGANTIDLETVNIANRPLGACGSRVNILVSEGGYGADSNSSKNVIGDGVVKTIPCGAKTSTTDYQDYEKFLGIKMEVDPYLLKLIIEDSFAVSLEQNSILVAENLSSEINQYDKLTMTVGGSSQQFTVQEVSDYKIKVYENIDPLFFENLFSIRYFIYTPGDNKIFINDSINMVEGDVYLFDIDQSSFFTVKEILFNQDDQIYQNPITQEMQNFSIQVNVEFFGEPILGNETIMGQLRKVSGELYQERSSSNYWLKYRMKVFGPQRYPVDAMYRTDGDHFGVNSFWEAPGLQLSLYSQEVPTSCWVTMNSAWVKMIYELSGRSVNFSRIPVTSDFGGGSIQSNIWNIISEQTKGAAYGWLNNSAFNPEGFDRVFSAYTYYPQFNNRGGGGRYWMFGWHSKPNYGGDAMSYVDFFLTVWRALRDRGARNAFGYFLTKGIASLPSLFYGQTLENLSGGWVASDGTQYPTVPIYISQLIRNGELSLSGSKKIKFDMGVSPNYIQRDKPNNPGMIPVIDPARDIMLTDSDHQSLIYDITEEGGSAYLQREPKINSTNALADFPGRHTVLDFGEVARRNSGGSYLNNIYTQDNYYYQEGLARIVGVNKYVLSENPSFLNLKNSFAGAYVFLRHIDEKLIIDSLDNTLPEYIPDFPEAYNPKFLSKNNVLALENKDDELSNSNINYTSDWFFKSSFSGAEFIDDNNIISISPDPRVVSQGENDSLSHSLFGNITSIKLSGERNFWGKFERGSSIFWLWFLEGHVFDNWVYLYTETSVNTGVNSWVYIIKDLGSIYDFLYFHYETQLWYGVSDSGATNIGTFGNINSEFLLAEDNKKTQVNSGQLILTQEEYNSLHSNSSIRFNNSVLLLGKDAFKLESVSNEAIAYVFFDGDHIPEGNLWIEAGNIAQYGLTKESDENRYGIMAQNGGLLNLENLGNPEYSPTVAEKQTATVMWETIYYNQKKYFANSANILTNTASNWCHVRGAHFVKCKNQIKEDLISKNQDFIFRNIYKQFPPNKIFYLLSRAAFSGFGYSNQSLLPFDGHRLHKTFPRSIKFSKNDPFFKTENTGVEILPLFQAEVSEQLKQYIDMAIEFVNSIVLNPFCITMFVRDIKEYNNNSSAFSDLLDDRNSLCFVPKSKINYSSTKRKIYWQQRDLERAQSYGLNALPGGAQVGDLRFEKPLVTNFTLYLNLEKLNDPSLGYYNYHDNFGPSSFPNHLNKFASMIVAQIIKGLGVGTLWNTPELLGFINPGQDDEESIFHGSTLNELDESLATQVFGFIDHSSKTPILGKDRELNLLGNIFGHYMVRTFEGQQYIGPESEYYVFEDYFVFPERDNDGSGLNFRISNITNIREVYVSYLKSDEEPLIGNTGIKYIENGFNKIFITNNSSTAYHYISIFPNDSDDTSSRKYQHNQLVSHQINTLSDMSTRLWKIIWYVTSEGQVVVVNRSPNGSSPAYWAEVPLSSTGKVIFPPVMLFAETTDLTQAPSYLYKNHRKGNFFIEDDSSLIGWTFTPQDSGGDIYIYANEISLAEKSITTESYAASEAIHQYKSLCAQAGFGGSQYYTDSIPLDSDPTEEYFVSDKILNMYNNPSNEYLSAENVPFVGDPIAVGLWILGSGQKLTSISLFQNELEFVNNNFYTDRYWVEGDDSNGRTRLRLSSHYCVSHKSCLPPGFLISIDCNRWSLIGFNGNYEYLAKNYSYITKLLILQYDPETQKNKLIVTSPEGINSDPSGENIHNLQVASIKNQIASNAKQPSLRKLISQYYIDYNSNSEILIDPITLGFLYDLGYDVHLALDEANYRSSLRHSDSQCKDHVITQDTFDPTNYEMI